MPLYSIDRLTPVKNTPLSLLVQAQAAAEAKRVADEIAYASAWIQGSYPDNEHIKAPDQWAEAEALAVLGLDKNPRPKRRKSRPAQKRKVA